MKWSVWLNASALLCGALAVTMSAQSSTTIAPVSSDCRFASWVQQHYGGKKTDVLKPIAPILPPSLKGKLPPLDGKLKGPVPECPAYTSQELQSMATKGGTEEYKIHVDWSMQDQGLCESSVQQYLSFVDRAVNTHVLQQCVTGPDGDDAPGVTNKGGRVVVGRACMMQYAIAAAHSKDANIQGLALYYTMATQQHNGEALQVLNGKQPEVLAYLLTK